MGFCTLYKRVQFTLERDSGRLLIWRERSTRYYLSNTVERHSYRGGGIMVWAGISLEDHSDLHVFQRGTLTDMIMQERSHLAIIAEEYLEGLGLERTEDPAQFPDLNSIEHQWD
ncbi:transposable element Tcb2 transposase [Trichonephila clavipes]|nr:transposable element Tcb2 transposase [Trichonephila clavipes]